MIDESTWFYHNILINIYDLCWNAIIDVNNGNNDLDVFLLSYQCLFYFFVLYFYYLLHI